VTTMRSNVLETAAYGAIDSGMADAGWLRSGASSGIWSLPTCGCSDGDGDIRTIRPRATIMVVSGGEWGPLVLYCIFLQQVVASMRGPPHARTSVNSFTRKPGRFPVNYTFHNPTGRKPR
jgi:hypothetical protein